MQELCNQEGYVENLFLYLWMQDPVLKQVPNIKIPETIIFRNSQIFQWYFSSDGQIKKKSKSKLSFDHIEEKFLNDIPKCGVVALWITKNTEIIGKKQQDNITYEYFDKDGLLKFLYKNNPNEIKEGVLQKFVIPKGDHNSILQVKWSNNLCFFEKIQNTRKLNDKGLDMYQRILTYEVPNTNSEVIQLKGNYLISSLETIANNIQQHIANLSFERFKINRLNLIFKITNTDQLVFIGCTSLRVFDRKLQGSYKAERINEAIIQLPDYVDTSKIGMQDCDSLNLDNQCSSCLKLINNFSTYNIKMKFVVQSWEFDHDGKKQVVINQEKKDKLENIQKNKHLSKQDVQNFKSEINLATRIEAEDIFIDVERSYNIPKVIRNMWPKLKEEKYVLLKENPGFLDKNVEVCEQCYLDMMASCNIYENIQKLTKQVDMKKDFQGIGKLKPEALNDRFNRTRKNIQLKALFQDEEEGYNKKNANEQFNGFFSFGENINQDLRKYHDVLNKVGVKTNTRSDFYMDKLINGENYVDNYAVPKHVDKKDTKFVKKIISPRYHNHTTSITQPNAADTLRGEENNNGEMSYQIMGNNSTTMINHEQNSIVTQQLQSIQHTSYSNDDFTRLYMPKDKEILRKVKYLNPILNSSEKKSKSMHKKQNQYLSQISINPDQESYEQGSTLRQHDISKMNQTNTLQPGQHLQLDRYNSLPKMKYSQNNSTFENGSGGSTTDFNSIYLSPKQKYLSQFDGKKLKTHQKWHSQLPDLKSYSQTSNCFKKFKKKLA